MIKITTPIAVGARVINGTSNGVLYIDDSGNLAQDAADFYWDPTNNRLGIGLNTPQSPVDALGSDGANLVYRIKNSNSSGTAGIMGINDANSYSIYGYGGSARSDLLQSSGFTYTSAGGYVYANAASASFAWAIGGISSANQVMGLDSTAALSIGLAGTITGSLKLSGSTSGTVTVKPANAAGTWTMTLPTSAGTNTYVLQTDGSGNTSWVAQSGGGGGMSIGGSVTSGTAGSVLYIGSGPVLAQDNSNFFWDATNHRLGILTTSPSTPLDISTSLNGASLVGNVKNTDSGGNSAWRATSDTGRLVEYGMGGSAVGGVLGNRAYTYVSAGGMVYYNADTSRYDWYINANQVMTITTGGVGFGTTSPQGPIDLVGTASGGNLVIRVTNSASDGTSAIQALEANNNYCLFGYGGASRGDNLADRGYIYSQHGGFNFSIAGTNTFEITINGIGTSDRALEIDGSKNFVIGNAALSTTATDGFLYIPSCAGAPSGTPTSKTGRIAIVYDSSNNKLYAYNGAWKSVALA